MRDINLDWKLSIRSLFVGCPLQRKRNRCPLKKEKKKKERNRSIRGVGDFFMG